MTSVTVFGAARTAGTAEAWVYGLAVPFGQLSVMLRDKPDRGPYREKIGRFALPPDLLAEEVLLLLGHDRRRELASRDAGSLRLWLQSDGLHFEANIHGDRDMVREALACRGASITFRAAEESWSESSCGPIRTVLLVSRLAEISLGNNPAYPGTYSLRGW